MFVHFVFIIHFIPPSTRGHGRAWPKLKKIVLLEAASRRNGLLLFTASVGKASDAKQPDQKE
jgi:hypothetical protein